jgi:hypothetical protein
VKQTEDEAALQLLPQVSWIPPQHQSANACSKLCSFGIADTVGHKLCSSIQHHSRW